MVPGLPRLASRAGAGAPQARTGHRPPKGDRINSKDACRTNHRCLIRGIGRLSLLVGILATLAVLAGLRIARATEGLPLTSQDVGAQLFAVVEPTDWPVPLTLGSPASSTEPSHWSDPLGRALVSLFPEKSADAAPETLATSRDDAEEPRVHRPDWVGMGRDTVLLLGYQAVAIGVLYAMPSSVTGWSKKDGDVDAWWDNVRNPTWDKDGPFMNYLAHPYWGAAYYIRARERGFNRPASFAVSVALSALYEFGAEAFFEPPSYQDLIVTPVAGTLIGAFVFEPIRDRIKLKPELQWYDHVGLVLTDPLGAVNRVFEGLFGIKSDIRVHLRPPTLPDTDQRTARAAKRQEEPDERTRGVNIQFVLRWD
jgi:Domain of unknown function (DUF3943)